LKELDIVKRAHPGNLVDPETVDDVAARMTRHRRRWSAPVWPGMNLRPYRSGVPTVIIPLIDRLQASCDLLLQRRALSAEPAVTRRIDRQKDRKETSSAVPVVVACLQDLSLCFPKQLCCLGHTLCGEHGFRRRQTGFVVVACH